MSELVGSNAGMSCPQGPAGVHPAPLGASVAPGERTTAGVGAGRGDETRKELVELPPHVGTSVDPGGRLVETGGDGERYVSGGRGAPFRPAPAPTASLGEPLVGDGTGYRKLPASRNPGAIPGERPLLAEAA